jgi:N-acetylneuraminic acid mutarotase
MNQNRFIAFFISCVILAFIISGFSGNDNDPSSLSSSFSSSDINPVNGFITDMAGAWSTGAVFPAPLADLGFGQGYTRNDTGFVFVIGGEVGLPDVRIYNTVTNTWSIGAPMPTGRDRGASARLNGHIYVIGGANSSNTYTNTNYRYDINANSWSTMANIPQNVGWGKAVGYQDSLIYLLGGYNGTATMSNVYVYNTISNTWRAATQMPAIRFGGACAISGDTIVYVSGVDGAALVNTTYRGVIDPSDRSQITWTTGAPLPAPVSAGMFRIDAHSWGNRGIILTGGSTDVPFSSVSNVCYTYSPGANTWTAQPNKPTAWTAGQSGAVSFSNGIWKLVCASGWGGTGQINNTEIFTDTLAAPPGSNSTLVLFHDTTVAGGLAKRLADKDTLFKYLPELVSGYDVQYFDSNSTFSGLSDYKTIILVETSFDNSGALRMGLTARENLKTWMNNGTPGNKKALISIGGDQGYNYSRAASTAVDTVFSQQMSKYVYRADNGNVSGQNSITGVSIDVGNVRTYTTTPAGSGFYPDDCYNNGGSVLYHYTGRQTGPDSVASIGFSAPGYVVATAFQDPRYFTNGNFKNVLESLLGYITANGGTITGVQPVSSIIPDRFELKQNYPNPFNPSTKIEYSIPKNGLVTVRIYNMLGQEIKTLVSEFHNSGTYTVEFNASEFASGTYFYSLQASGFVETKKMILLK